MIDENCIIFEILRGGGKKPTEISGVIMYVYGKRCQNHREKKKIL